MSEQITLARPYARAAFELAREAGELGGWQSRLDTAAAIVEAPAMRAVIGDPRLSAAQQVALVLPPNEGADGAFGRFVQTLVANRRLALLPEIAQLYGELKRDAERTLRVTVKTAVPLEAAQAEALKASLARRFDKRIELETAIDPAVLGGALIDAGDQVIDATLRGRLARLEAELTR